MTNRRFGIVFLLGMLLAAAVSAPGVEDASGEAPLPVPEIDEAALRRHVEELAACGSRVPGYPGHDQATQYLRDEFQRLGYTDIQEDEFEVTVPVDEGSSVEIVDSGRRFTLSALWPNLVRTSQLPSDGVTGIAVDGKGGHWNDFNGSEIENNIVFMDFNSDARWLNAAILGAQHSRRSRMGCRFCEDGSPLSGSRNEAHARLGGGPGLWGDDNSLTEGGVYLDHMAEFAGQQ